jgi:hypothetical protein
MSDIALMLRIADLEAMMAHPGFWDLSTAQELSAEHTRLHREAQKRGLMP